MIMRLLRSVTVLLHVRYILCDELCGKTTVVTGAAGGDVSLRMNEENIDDVTWSYKYNRIASTGPQKPMNVTPTYSGKLASDHSGSLNILNLQQEDEGTYDASIKLLTGVLCTAHYQLHVYEILSGNEIKISHNVLSHEPCRMTLTCTANGSDVTIAWSSGGININNDVVNITDPDPKTLYICTAQNPVSNTTMVVTPREYCEKSQGNKTWIGVTVFVAVSIIIVAGYLYYRRQRRRR